MPGRRSCSGASCWAGCRCRSGIALLFPFQTALFAKTFGVINTLGAYVGLAPNLPTQLTPLQEMQYATSWHGIVALGLVVVIIAHIYIGTLGMQGAFSAMGTGQVDVNWAKEHHSLWAEREIRKMEDVAAAETDVPRAGAPAGMKAVNGAGCWPVKPEVLHPSHATGNAHI